MRPNSRCAVYTRKSSEEGLEQSFNSLHAQRETCEAYVLNMRAGRSSQPSTMTAGFPARFQYSELWSAYDLFVALPAFNHN